MVRRSDVQHDDLQRVAGIYDRIAPTWDARQGFVERVLMGDAMRSALARELHGEILEVGTGTGATFPHIDPATTGIRTFTGVDLSPGMLVEARAAAARLALPFPVTFDVMHAGALAFPDASFDTVTTSLTLCTVPDLAAALIEMARVCRPGGRIVLLEHVRARNPLFVLPQRMLTPLQVRMLGCHLDRPTDRLVRDLGFTVEREQARFFGIFRLLVASPPGATP